MEEGDTEDESEGGVAVVKRGKKGGGASEREGNEGTWKEMRARAVKAERELHSLRFKYEEMAGEMVGIRELKTKEGKLDVGTGGSKNSDVRF